MKKVEDDVMGTEWHAAPGDMILHQCELKDRNETFQIEVTETGLAIRTVWGRVVIVPEVSNSIRIHSTKTFP